MSAAMKLVLEFDKLLHSIIEAKAPVSASKIQLITKAALKNEQLFHLVVSSIVKFTQKCPNDFKLSALYVVDSISRAILKANSPNLLVLFQDKLDDIFSTVTNASSKDKEKAAKLVQLWKKSVFDQSKLELIESAYLKDTETVRLLNPVPQFSNQIIPTKNMRDPRNNLANNTVLQPTIMQPIMQPIIQPAIQPALPDSLIASLSSNYTVAAALLPLLQQAQAAGQQEQFLSILSTPEGLAQITSLLYNGQLGSLGIQQPQANPLNFDYDEEDGIKKKAPVAQPTINQTSLNQTALNQTSLLNQTAFNQTALNQTALTQSAFNQPRHSIDINRNVANLSLLTGIQQPPATQKTPLEPQNAMFLASTHGEKYQQDQKPTHAERFSNQEKYSNQTRSDSRFVTSNNDPKEDDIPGPKCMVAYFNQDVPQGHVRVRSRTCYVGNVNADVNLENLRAAFETVGRVETIALNFDKYNAFVKMYTRAEAEDAIQKMNRFSIGSSVLKVNWGCGFGPRTVFNYDKGESIINLATLAEPDTRWMATSRRGGGPAESGYVMEEPAVGFASKHDTAVGTPKYPPHLSKQKPRTSTTSRQSSPVNEKMPESTLQTNNSFQTNNYFGEMDPAMMEQYKSQYSEQDWNALLLQQQQWMAQYGYQFQPGMYDYKVGDKRGSDQSYDESRKR